MDRKLCTPCKIEKNIEGVYNKITECKFCSSKRSLKRYYENKYKLSNQWKTYYEKNREKLSQKQINSHENFKEFHKSYVELQNKSKTVGEKFSKN